MASLASVPALRPSPSPDRLAPLAQQALDALYTHYPELAERDGAFGAAERCAALHTHLTQLVVARDHATPALFRDHLRWAASLARTRGGRRADVAHELQVLAGLLAHHADAELRALGALLGSERVGFEAQPDEVPPPPVDDGPHVDALLVRLLADDVPGTETLLRDAIHATGQVSTYMQVVTPVMHEIGRLWQSGTISAATEHRCTVTLERALEHLRMAAVPRQAGVERVAVVSATPGESHTVAVGMIADLLQDAGWQVHRLGWGVTAAEVDAVITRTGASLVVLSIVRSANFGGLSRLVAGLQARPDAQRVRVLVGGAPFARLPELRAKVAADAVGVRLDEVLPLAERLLAA